MFRELRGGYFETMEPAEIEERSEGEELRGRGACPLTCHLAVQMPNIFRLTPSTVLSPNSNIDLHFQRGEKRTDIRECSVQWG